MPRMRGGERNTVTMIVDDMSLNIRRMFPGAETWNDVGLRVRKRVMDAICDSGDNLKEYWVVWDTAVLVPQNKDIVRAKRDGSHKAVGFTEQEIATLTIGRGDIPAPSQKYFERLMLTRSMLPELHAFVTSELLLTPLPEGVKLIICGSVGHIARDRVMHSRFPSETGAAGDTSHYYPGQSHRGDDYPIRFSNAREPKSAFDHVTQGYYAYLSGVCRLSVTHNLVTRSASVHIAGPMLIGEGDLKIPFAISQQPHGSNVLVRCYDTDMLPILLLHMRYWIARDESGMGVHRIKYNVFLDLNPPTKAELPVNMTHLFRILCMRFRQDFPYVRAPIETFCALLLLSGSDYTTQMSQITPKCVWESFREVGHVIIFDPSIPDVMGIGAETLVTTPSGQQYVSDQHFGDHPNRVNVKLDENCWQRFVVYCYWRVIFRKQPWKLLENNMDKMREARTNKLVKLKHDAALRAEEALAAGAAATRRNNGSLWDIPDDVEIVTAVRRLHWTLDYFFNAHRAVDPEAAPPFIDPFEVDAHGISLRGWSLDATGKASLAHVSM